jgi:hypothetical protein
MRFLALPAVLVVALALGTAGAPAKSTEPCRSAVQTGVLPPWARGGFSSPRPRIAHVLGRRGDIVAILFAQPLSTPPAADHSNKILWVARVPVDWPSDLRISAQRMTATRPVGAPVARRLAGGPGPSIVNLPQAGCWRLTLRWSHRVDSLDLLYRAPR